jgi:REP element-mobilizing transposase RayT
MPCNHDMHRQVAKVPLAYFITVRTYGTWLHGDERGSVDRDHNQFGAPLLPADVKRQQSEEERLRHPPIFLTAESAALVEKTVREVCIHRKWELHTVKARTNHFHAIVSAGVTAERVMNDFKAWATRRLREYGFVGVDQQVWVHHGSTPYLWTPDELHSAIDYVENRQGPPLM